MASTAVPDPPKRHHRLEWLSELLFGVQLDRPLRCPHCHWTHHRARVTTLRLLANGHLVRCTWCAQPLTQQEPPR